MSTAPRSSPASSSPWPSSSPRPPGGASERSEPETESEDGRGEDDSWHGNRPTTGRFDAAEGRADPARGTLIARTDLLPSGVSPLRWRGRAGRIGPRANGRRRSRMTPYDVAMLGVLVAGMVWGALRGI